jgi:hypothetical protein
MRGWPCQWHSRRPNLLAQEKRWNAESPPRGFHKAFRRSLIPVSRSQTAVTHPRCSVWALRFAGRPAQYRASLRQDRFPFDVNLCVRLRLAPL